MLLVTLGDSLGWSMTRIETNQHGRDESSDVGRGPSLEKPFDECNYYMVV